MATEDRIRRALEHASTAVEVDLGSSRRAVATLAAGRADRDHRRLAVAAALAVLVIIAFGWLAARDLQGGAPEPAGPVVPSPSGSAPVNPFRVERTFTRADLGLRHPLGITIAPSGHVFVSDRADTVTELTWDGRVVRRWGSPGAGRGQLRLAGGAIAVGGDGRVYVADTGNFRVQVFSPSGQPLAAYGTFGTGPGQFQWPSDIAVDDRGDIYVTDDRSATVTKLDATGRQLWRIGDARTRSSDLVGHEHLAQLDARGRLLMANDDAGRVVYLTPDGHEAEAFGSGASAGHETGRLPEGGDFPAGACDATADERGFVVVNSCEEKSSQFHTTQLFDPAHGLVGVWPSGPFSESPRFGPHGEIAVLGPDGTLMEIAVRYPG